MPDIVKYCGKQKYTSQLKFTTSKTVLKDSKQSTHRHDILSICLVYECRYKRNLMRKCEKFEDSGKKYIPYRGKNL